ncbi:MAG: domain S-box [Solirubrobacterales bacterium]|nr:domain S-box [Solirubrobacterales bacterium]
MPHSLTDLAGLKVSAEDFLSAVLETAAQAIWVVDPDDLIRFANPAAITALGYDSADELLGRDSHETIHHKHPDGTRYPAAECPMRLPRTTGQTVTRDLDWFVRRDGSMFPVSYVSVPIAVSAGRGAVVAFTDIEDRPRAEEVLRERDAVLGAREDSLRRIAALVAGGAASADVFAAIAREVGYVVGVSLVVVCRYDPGRATATVIGVWSEFPHPFQAGTRWPLDGPTLLFLILKTGRPAKIDDFTGIPGTIADAGRKAGFGAAAGAPIIVDGEIWGAMMANAGRGPVPDRMEERLAAFTELLATAISNTESRAGLGRLAEEQAALRRVATLVARGEPPESLFAAVVEEVGQLLPVEYAGLSRYEPEGALSMVASSGRALDHIPVGSRWTLGGKNVATMVFETGRPSRIDSYADPSDPGAVTAFREVGVRSAVGTPIVVDGRLWGVMIAGTTAEQPIPADTEARLASFTELLATAIANAESRAGLARLAEEQAALRRVATLVARGTRPEEVFAAVANEVARLLSVDLANLCRYESDGTLTFVASAGERFPVDSRWPLGGHNLATLLFETGRPARIDNYADATGPLTADIREQGIRTAVGTPILVEGRLWGMMTAGSSQEQPLPADTEARLASFTELVAAAIANTEARTEVGRLAEEQAALRRVATLVAEGAAPSEVFQTVTREVGILSGADLARMERYESGDSVIGVAGWSRGNAPGLAVGKRFSLEGASIAAMVHEASRPVRVDSFVDAHGPIAWEAQRLGIRSSVGCPIVVEGRLWGVIAASSKSRTPFLPDTESQIGEFTELVATAVANAESRADLAASRARIVAAADESRRRIERDLHDGTQQQLVTLMLELRAAEATEPFEVGDLRAQLARTAQGLDGVLEELREISRGIHPAILSRGGLERALTALARRSPVPVQLDQRAQRRLPAPVEVAAYYVVSEALTNVAKHAHASVVHVELDAHDGTFRLAIRDDGVGGADPARGSGLVGLSDRIEALGGTLQVTSPAGNGTTLLIEIPVGERGPELGSRE